jgi:pantoate--beta-alanine ligase
MPGTSKEGLERMQIIDSVSGINVPRPLGYVPTMGALHAGHISLVEAANAVCESTLVSIFVNPLQFENQIDLATYPKTKETDELLLAESSLDYLWYPKAEEVIPDNQPILSSGEWGNLFEGKSRPGHFDGVVTIVAKYLELLNPEFIFLGEKDWQQLRILERYIQANKINTKVIRVETVRERNGLALSSRNAKLTPIGRNIAEVIYRALSKGSTAKTADEAKAIAADIFAEEPRFTLDYFEMIDSDSMSVVNGPKLGDRLICAGWVEGIRLIDNLAVKS